MRSGRTNGVVWPPLYPGTGKDWGRGPGLGSTRRARQLPEHRRLPPRLQAAQIFRCPSSPRLARGGSARLKCVWGFSAAVAANDIVRVLQNGALRLVAPLHVRYLDWLHLGLAMALLVFAIVAGRKEAGSGEGEAVSGRYRTSFCRAVRWSGRGGCGAHRGRSRRNGISGPPNS